MLLLSETVETALTGGDESVAAAFVAATTLMSLTILINHLAFHWPWFETLRRVVPASSFDRGESTGG